MFECAQNVSSSGRPAAALESAIDGGPNAKFKEGALESSLKAIEDAQ